VVEGEHLTRKLGCCSYFVKDQGRTFDTVETRVACRVRPIQA
jgi:hypothetical protein